jgi:hypothetical protein
MKKDIYFDRIFGPGWPSFGELEPYFQSPPKGRGWFHESGNDSAGIRLEGVEGTEHLPEGKGRVDVKLSMWGDPDLGVLLIYRKFGGGDKEVYSSKGDLSRIRQWVRTTHDDPMPVGLYIPFAKAWLAVKEFMETEGKLPASIEWIKNSDLPEGTFPDPTVRLPGEDD